VLLVGLNWIGDSIMAMPAVQAWRRAYPDTRLTLLVKKGLASLWSLHAAPDDVLTYENGLAATVRAAAAVRAAAPARAYVLPHSFRSALVPFLAGVPERVGLPGRGRDFLLTRVVPPRLGPGRLHQGFEYCDLLLTGPDVTSLAPPELVVPEAALAAARNQVAALPDPLLGLLPGAARGPAKRWPTGHFAAVARRWVQEQKGGVLLMGGRDDQAACDALAAETGPGALSLAGRTTVPEWAALLKTCRVVVANDSGGMHLAAALRVPVAAVYGLTNPDQTGPLGPRCRIIQDPGARARDVARDSAEAQKRLAAISPERVYQAAAELLAAP